MKKQHRRAVVWMAAAALVVCAGCSGQGGLEKDLAYLTSDTCAGRLPGTAGNEAAADYLETAFAEAGLEPLEGQAALALPYTQDTFDPAACGQQLTVEYPDGRGATFAAGVDFYPYWGNVTDFQGTLTDDPAQPGILLAGQKTDVNVPQIVSEASLFQTAGTTYTGLPLHLPAAVFDQLEPGAAITLTEAALHEDATIENLAGVLPGQDRSRAWVICAHFDHVGSFGETVYAGALDNASGVVTMLELLRQMAADEQPPVDLVFCALNGEDMGLLGSQALVEQDVLGVYDQYNVINLDTVGWAGADSYVVTEDDPALAEELCAALQEAGLAVEPGDYGRSDHISFLDAGIPAVAISSAGIIASPGASDGEASPIHTVNDTVDVVNPDELRTLAGALAAFLRSNPEMAARVALQAADFSDPAPGLYRIAQQLGLAPGQRVATEYEQNRYVISYEPPYTDWDAWQARTPGCPLPQSWSGYAWAQAVYESSLLPMNLPAEPEPSQWLQWRMVFDAESEQAAIQRPHQMLTAGYTNPDGFALQLCLRREMPPAVEGTAETEIQRDGVTLIRRANAAGDFERLWWQDPATGVVLEMYEQNFTNRIGEEAVTAAMIELVQGCGPELAVWFAAG